MSRAYRKLLQQRELQNQTAETLTSEEEEGSEEEIVSKPNLFGMLMTEEDNEAEEEEEMIEPRPTIITPVIKKKKNARKKPSFEEEDLDKVLKELNIEIQEELPVTETHEFIANERLLIVDPKQLNPEMELRRMFGSVAISEQKRRTNQKMVKKLALARPIDTWPRLTKVGLSMDLLKKNEDGTLEFSFTHSKSYQDAQKEYLQCVATNDPNTIGNFHEFDDLAMLMQMYPYHIDALLQWSEVTKHNGDLNMAAELVERSLFHFETAFHPSFTLASPKCRLTYKRIENRPFFIALFKYLDYVSRKGCWRTALEFGKLILSLSPENDPLGMILLLDTLALRAEDSVEWLISTYEHWKGVKGLDLLPNWAYSIALGFYKKNHPDKTQKLIKAISYYPHVAIKLLEKCGAMEDVYMTHLNEELASGLEILVNLYVERSNSIWKEPNVLEWLKQTVKSTLLKSVNKDEQKLKEKGMLMRKTKYPAPIPLSILRHVFLCDIPNVIVPTEYRAATMLANDPFPPKDAETSVYDEWLNQQDAVSLTQDMDLISAFASSILPWTRQANNEAATQEERLFAMEQARQLFVNLVGPERLNAFQDLFQRMFNNDAEPH